MNTKPGDPAESSLIQANTKTRFHPGTASYSEFLESTTPSLAKAEPLEGWRVHPKAKIACNLMMLACAGLASEGFVAGLPSIWQVLILTPGIVAASVLTLQHAAIWQRTNRS